MVGSRTGMGVPLWSHWAFQRCRGTDSIGPTPWSGPGILFLRKSGLETWILSGKSINHLIIISLIMLITFINTSLCIIYRDRFLWSSWRCWLFLFYMSIDNFGWGIERLHGTWYMTPTYADTPTPNGTNAKLRVTNLGMQVSKQCYLESLQNHQVGPSFFVPKKRTAWYLLFCMHPHLIPIWSCTTPNCRFSKVSIRLSIGFKNT